MPQHRNRPSQPVKRARAHAPAGPLKSRPPTRQRKTAACAAVLHREANLAYQAATTAPLNLVSMNCFTAGLW